MDELMLKVIDKVFLGFVVAGVGYFFASQFEYRKKRMALLEELSKRKADLMIDVFGAVTVYESKVQEFLASLVSEELDSSDLEEHQHDLQNARDSVVEKAQRSRFLIGEELYGLSAEYTELVFSRLTHVVTSDFENLKKTDESIEMVRIKIQKQLPQLYQS